MKVFARITLMMLALAVPFGTSHAMGQFYFLESPLVGEPAPDFTLKDLGGKDVNFASFREGKSSIIFFWATWCPVCEEKLKELSAKREELEQKGVKVLLVDLEETPKEVRSYLDNNKVAIDVVIDEKSSVAETYNIFGVPTLIFVDAAGVVQAVEHDLPENYLSILSVPPQPDQPQQL
ncbi:MAG: TlpA disulfide reductase family protein [Candidatus Omnitrophota bacterium]|nr:TlpA disulfide reductase family protein [Candidatus Omnitrophota bacterium]MDZ4242460.1 TlpA disulfide reductase family protein [Candidatus Omnitrophota bacterium]